ncbi:MAG: hypothetical protein WDN31_21815 [Hyphomicrobium sp.]
MKYPFLIAIGAGLVSAVVFVSAASGPLVMGMLLFVLAPLALLLAGLALGPTAAAVAGLTGILLVALAGSAFGALAFAVGQAVPAFVLVYLASLNRQGPDGETEWYPAGRLVIAAALMGGVFAAFT